MLNYDRKRVKSWAKSRIPLLWKKRYTIIAAVVLAVFFLLFRNFVTMLAVMAAFIALGVASMMYNRWVKVSLGVELIMLGMVITSVAYGPLQGLIVGAVALFIAEIITDRFTYSTFVSFIGIFAVAMIAPRLGMGITWVGIWMTLLYDAIIGPGYLVMGSSPWRTALFVVTHILFNAWVFAFLAPPLFNLLS